MENVITELVQHYKGGGLLPQAGRLFLELGGEKMGLADVFSKEDRVDVTFSDFTKIIKLAVKSEIIMNGINCNVPHRYLREMATGRSEEPVNEPVCEEETYTTE